MVQRILAVLCVLFVSASVASAQKITLESFDGTLRLSGELVSYDGVLYVLDSPIGPIEIEAELVTCVSEVCPALDVRSEDEPLRVSGSQGMTDTMLPLVLETYGFGNDLEMVFSSNSDTGNPSYLLQSLEGDPVLQIESEATGTEGGFLSLLENQSLITFAARRIRVDENEWFSTVSPNGLRTPQSERVIGLDGIAVIVS